MPKAKRFLTLDCESTGLGKRALIFDIGYTIATRKNDILERSFLVRDVLCNGRAMLSAVHNPDWCAGFGAKLFEHYIPNIDSQEYRLKPWNEILAILRDDILTYDVDVFGAYNLAFDRGAMQTTDTYVNGKQRKIMPKAIDILDLWLFACQTVCNTPTYHRAADQFGWRSDAGNVRTTAEKAYAFLTGEFDFVESHTALHDAQIETEILRRLLDKRKAIPYNSIMASPWRLAQNLN